MIYLHYYEGYAAKEIAALLGKTPAAVASLLHRGAAAAENSVGKRGIRRMKDYRTSMDHLSFPQTKSRP